jgi:hypothetical protein
MGIVLYGGGVDQIKGKVGGSVFQKMGQSLGVRGYRSNCTSNSSLARNRRFSMNVLAQAWTNLSSVQRNSWISAAPTYPAFNRYGAAIVLSPYQLFVKINKRQLVFGGSLILSAINYNIEHYLSFNMSPINYGTNHLDITLLEALSGSHTLLLYLTKIASIGINTQNLKYNFWISLANDAATTINLWSFLPDNYKINPGTSKSFNVLSLGVNSSTGIYNQLGTALDQLA